MGVFGSIKLKRREKKILLGFTEDGEEFSVTLRAPSLGVIDEVNARLKAPSAPVLKDPQTNNPIPVRDPKTGDVVMQSGQPLLERNTNDAEFKRKMKRHNRANGVALFYAMSGDQLQPSKSIDDFGGDWEAFYLHLWEEMEEAGVGIDKFNELSNAATSLIVPMTSEEVQKAREELGVDAKSDQETKDRLKAEGHKVPSGK